MTLAHDALSHLEALAYEAALEPALWPEVVADASDAFKAPYAMLCVADRGGKKVMHAAPPGLDELAEVIMARYSTCEINVGFAFAALAPPTDCVGRHAPHGQGDRYAERTSGDHPERGQVG